MAQPDEIGISVLVKPPATHDELFTEIPDVCDWPAEAGEAELQEGKEDFNGRAALTLVRLGWMRDDRHTALLLYETSKSRSSFTSSILYMH